jgi:hypothetical protein
VGPWCKGEKTLTGHTSTGIGVTSSADGHTLATVSSDRTQGNSVPWRPSEPI